MHDPRYDWTNEDIHLYENNKRWVTLKLSRTKFKALELSSVHIIAVL